MPRLETVAGLASGALPRSYVLKGGLIGLFGILSIIEFNELVDFTDWQPDARPGAPILIAHFDGGGLDETPVAQHLQIRAFKNAAAVVAESDGNDFAGKVLYRRDRFAIFGMRGDDEDGNSTQAAGHEGDSQ